jgi:RNA polymerase sigma-70 factor (ECF subfamily)
MGQLADRSASDADLVRRALLGAREPFAELVRRHQRTATALAARVLGSEDLARDAVQEATVAAMTGLDRLRSADRFGPWFCGIALNVSRRWLRQLRAERPTVYPDQAGDGAGPDGRAGPDELAELADLAARVRAAIAALADGQRDAVFLFYLQGLSHREVAAELGISVGAVKARLHQARAALAPRLAPLVDTQEGTAMTETTGTATANAPEWVDVTPLGVRREGGDDPQERKYVMLLEAADGRGRLPIWIGPAEGTALALTLQAVETPRPMTYQLAASLLRAAGGHAVEARITRLSDCVFYAVVVVDGPEGRQEVDARPSDAVTLAAVMNAPIRAEASLFTEPPVTERPGFDWESFPTDTADLAAETKQRIIRRFEPDR